MIVAEDDTWSEKANWNLKRKGITDSQLGKILVKISVIHFLARTIADTKINLYSCPLYKTMDRVGTLSLTE